MARHLKAETRGVPRQKRRPARKEEQERILQKAQHYLLVEAKRPMLWTVAGIREQERASGARQWIIAVHLRYPNGFEGYLGDLLYDGTQVTELTSLELMRERAQQIAKDPEGIRQWNEYRATTLRARKT